MTLVPLKESWTIIPKAWQCYILKSFFHVKDPKTIPLCCLWLPTTLDPQKILQFAIWVQRGAQTTYGHAMPESLSFTAKLYRGTCSVWCPLLLAHTASTDPETLHIFWAFLETWNLINLHFSFSWLFHMCSERYNKNSENSVSSPNISRSVCAPMNPSVLKVIQRWQI